MVFTLVVGTIGPGALGRRKRRRKPKLEQLYQSRVPEAWSPSTDCVCDEHIIQQHDNARCIIDTTYAEMILVIT
jgi:hypothetical protein